jgi:hypothetical protein
MPAWLNFLTERMRNILLHLFFFLRHHHHYYSTYAAMRHPHRASKEEESCDFVYMHVERLAVPKPKAENENLTN